VLIHFVSPGVSDSIVAGGGAAIFRGLAVLLSRIGDVVAYEPSASATTWEHPAIRVRRWRRASDAVRLLTDSIAPGDMIVKIAGSFPGSFDFTCDVSIADLRRDRPNLRYVYVDVDAPSRLPILQYSALQFDSGLSEADGIVVIGGGPRAVHGYRAYTSSPIAYFTMALAWEGVIESPLSSDATSRTWDLITAFGSDRDRDTRLADVLDKLRSLNIAVVGRSSYAVSTTMPRIGYLDGRRLSDLIADARFTLCLVRADVRGYSDVHPCRVVEAVRNRSTLLTEPFLGLDNLVPPTACTLIDPSAGAAYLQEISEPDRKTMADRAYRHLHGVARDQSQRFISWAKNLSRDTP
jgi:hypothetical protein